jgi:hypothetical protein
VEVTSQAKKAPRAQKPAASKKGSGVNLNQSGNRLTGQKKKQVKSVYRPKGLVNDPEVPSLLNQARNNLLILYRNAPH